MIRFGAFCAYGPNPLRPCGNPWVLQGYRLVTGASPAQIAGMSRNRPDPRNGTTGESPDAAPARPRTRTRKSIADRQQEMLDAAAGIVVSEGLGEVTVRRVAAEIGLSQAQGHNCFSRRIDLLLALTRRELERVESARRDVALRGGDVQTAVILSTISYLDDMERRGPLLQSLLRVAQIRAALRGERDEAARRSRTPLLASMQQRYGMNEAEAAASNAVLSAIVLRAGSLLAAHRIRGVTASRLSLSLVLAGMRSNAARGTPD